MVTSAPPLDSILLLAGDRKDQRLLAKALGATGCLVEFAASPEEAERCVKIKGPQLIVADYDPDPNETGWSLERYDKFLESIAYIGDSPRRTRVLLLADKRQKEELGSLFRLPFLTNLIAKNHPLDLDELIITTAKIINGDIFGIEKYLCYGVKPVTHIVRSSRDKTPLLETLANYATGLGINKRLVTVAKSVADELIMNAIYNAPVREDGSRPYAHVARTDAVDLASHETCRLTYACDGRQLVIAMLDRFGSLAVETIREYLQRCFAMGADQIEVKRGGAGMGLYFIVEALNKVIINICPGRGTEVIGVIDISGSYRDYAEKNKSFHIFLA